MKRVWSALAVALALDLLFFCCLPKEGTKASQLDDLKGQIEELQKESEELKEAKKELDKALGDLNLKLGQVSEELSELEKDFAVNETRLALAQAEYEQAEEQKLKQYEDMKLRIKYMYENGISMKWELVLQAGSISELLNRMEYISQINAADRRMLEEYEESCKKIEEDKKALEEQGAELQQDREALEEKKAELLAAIAREQENLDNAQEALGDKQQEAEKIAEKIRAMEEYERKIKEQKAKEEAKRLAEKKRQEEIRRQEEELKNQDGEEGKKPVTPTTGEEELFAALIYCEAGGEPYEGQLAVASVVLNRIRSQYFASTITDVIYQKGQFSPVASGKLALVLERGLTTDSCRRAMREVLDGNITGDWLYFRMDNGLIKGDIIGNQVFY